MLYDKESGRKIFVLVVVSLREYRKIRELRLLKVRDYEGDGKFVFFLEEWVVIELDVIEKGFFVLKLKFMEYYFEERGFFFVLLWFWGMWVSFLFLFLVYEDIVEEFGVFKDEEVMGI